MKRICDIGVPLAHSYKKRVAWEISWKDVNVEHTEWVRVRWVKASTVRLEWMKDRRSQFICIDVTVISCTSIIYRKPCKHSTTCKRKGNHAASTAHGHQTGAQTAFNSYPCSIRSHLMVSIFSQITLQYIENFDAKHEHAYWTQCP